MAGPLVCTVVARNYAATARVLARSFLRHHPDGRVVVLAVDDPDHSWSDADEPFELRYPDQLGGLPVAELWRMAMAYSVTELATAVKPWLLRDLLADHGGPVLFLDPDVVVLAPVDDVVAAAAGDRRVVTPHALHPIPRDGRSPDETFILAAGTFNLGFLALGPGPRTSALLDWWGERLAREAVSDPANMRFTDQRWMDLAATHFPVDVLRDPGCNVAWWNLHERPLGRDGDGTWLAGGVPLRLFHHSGFDPRTPDVLSRHQGPRPRVTPGQDPLVRDLLREVAAALLAEGHLLASRQPYGWSRAGDLRLDPTVRRLYRDALLAAEAAAGPGGQGPLAGEPPNPFAPGGPDALRAWLDQPDHRGLPRILVGLHADRPDLQATFPDLDDPAQAAGLRHWAAIDEDVVLDVDPSVLPRGGLGPAVSAVAAGDPLPGVDLFGYLDAELGMGESGRALHDGLRAAGVPVAPRLLGGHHSRRGVALAPPDAGGAPYDVSVLCVNADQVPVVVAAGDPPVPDGPRAGLWFWETSHLPARFHRAFDVVDEVWVASRYTGAAVAAAAEEAGVDVPVRLVPLPVPQPSWTPRVDRAALGLPEGRLHLYCFDLLSVMERKHPFGLLEAWRAAFDPGEGAVLVLKTINGHQRPAELGALVRASADRPDVQVLDGYLPPHRQRALMAAADVYVSLHRAEGFGLTLAEAMVHDVPVVATAYSGSLELADEGTAHLVPATEVPVPASCTPYADGGSWGEPDLGAAARVLRRLAEHPEEGRTTAARARERLATTRTPEACAAGLAAAVDALRAGGCPRLDRRPAVAA